MFGTIPARRFSRLGAVTAAVILGLSAVTGCAAGQITQTSDQVPNHDGAHGRVGQVTVDNALISAPDQVDKTVAYHQGSPAPLTLYVTNDSLKSDTLTSVTTSAGDVELSGDTTIDPESYLQIGGDSATSATISSLNEDLKYGFPVSATFYFQHAGQISMNIAIAIPGERESGRPTLDIYEPPPTNVWGEPQ